MQRKRRLKKRKRRPTPSLEASLSDEALPTRKRLFAQSLEDGMEPWKEITGDAVRRSSIRRRITPTFQPSQEMVEDVSNVELEGELHETQNQETVESIEEVVKEPEKPEPIPDLKAVLKQSGTGSLSEILQQKNLSLSELLMGNQKAISALTDTVTEPKPLKQKRLPPSIALRKNINRNLEQEDESFEALSAKEMLEAQRKRLSLLGHKENRLFSSVTKYDVVTEPATERRIFVPSHPKYYTSLVFKPDIDIYNEPSTETIEEVSTTTTTTTPKVVSGIRSLPLTNAKLNKLTTKVVFETKEAEEENYPTPINFPKPIPISLQEVSGYTPERIKTEIKPTLEEGTSEGPLRLSIDLDAFVEKTTLKPSTENYAGEKPTPLKVESTTTADVYSEKLPQATAKDEIMEIMKDPISRERLSRILENRNMTVNELVEQRERGSSQLHLADIFHNKTKEPEPKGEPFVGTVNSELFNSFPLFGRKQRNKTFENGDTEEGAAISTSSTVAPVVEIKEKVVPEPPFAVTSFPSVKIGLHKSNEQIQPFLWKELQENDNPQNNNKEIYSDNDPLKAFQEDLQDQYSEEELQRLEDIDATLSMLSKEKLDVETSGYQHDQDEVLIKIPSGVKSAIFVSLAIICLSIVVFLTILLLFRWVQRKNKTISYCSSLSTKIRSPMIIQRKPATAIKSFVTETLGRNKNSYYKSNVQSTEGLWDCGAERIPSF
ncbi:hypothetical protein NQ315_007635 [Exocentrus adspersus]|uniref:Uncharacterized protein n=1 Tax=Exocentrus adspersus TaxID=1586481 RepID=A0AAV8W8A7_9CUCU|nr:hypothetical protein NQ315_007635 [Exocentrus adspersus]